MNFLSLSQEEKQILLGGLLGDTYFNKKTRTFRYTHCLKQKSYLEWKHSFFNDNANDICRKITDYQRIIYGQERFGYCFEIYGKDKCLLDLETFLTHHLYSNEGRKKISLKYLNELDALGLSVWWMDDGSLCVNSTNRWGKLCTEKFNYEEHILIQKYFEDRWGINTTIKQEKGKYYFIRFNASELKQLIKIIYPYVCEVPSMIYKIDMKYTRRNSIGEEFEEIYDHIERKKVLFNGT